MNTLEDFITEYLGMVEAAIEQDPPTLPEWSDDLSSREVYDTKTYQLPDQIAIGSFDGEEIEVSFYADTMYNEAFYAFVSTGIAHSVELNDGADPTFGGLAGFRIYLGRE
jgi:hypothetical protein